MKKRLVLIGCTMLLLTVTAVAANKKFTLVIDAGHGGHDAGAIGAITKEKAINLNVAMAFGSLVERNCPDVKVIYTRKTDVFVPLHTRADIANRNKADLFISIHTNALPKGCISRGIETYTLGMHRAADNLDVAMRENEVILYEKDYKQRYQGFDPNSSESYIMFEFIQDHNMAQSVELAKFVQRRLCSSAGRQDKGVKQAGFLVLRETSMPSCLIELGFISTADEERFLHSADGVSRLGQGIYQAFLDYRRKYNSSKKTKIVQELEDAREGREPAAGLSDNIPTKPNADSIVAAVPTSPKPTVQEPAPPVKPVESPKPASPSQLVNLSQSTQPAAVSSAPIFKVQILASSYKLKATDAQLKGQNADYYEEGGLYKYTVGASADYNEIYQLRKSLVDRFPQAFVVAFKDGKKMNVQEAIQEFKSRKKK